MNSDKNYGITSMKTSILATVMTAVTGYIIWTQMKTMLQQL